MPCPSGERQAERERGPYRQANYKETGLSTDINVTPAVVPHSRKLKSFNRHVAVILRNFQARRLGAAIWGEDC